MNKLFNDLERDNKADVVALLYGFFQSQKNKFYKKISMDTLIIALMQENPQVEKMEKGYTINVDNDEGFNSYNRIRIACLESVKPF